MTQQEQQEFRDSLQAAQAWMQAVQDRLQANDNTQGPRAALEARLRETEKIHASSHEGRVKMDMALVAADVLLQSGDEETRNHTLALLKELKAQWEETQTYIIHCHSRIEWVWLHWSEYLKAYEEFETWLCRLRRLLEADVELQLGVKEKLWQVDHQRVAVSDVRGQAPLLERLLDEAAALHGRTEDPSVEPRAQERLQGEYNDVRDRAEERLLQLQKIAEEHQMYKGCVHKFQAWLLSKTKELSELLDKKDTAENRLKALQALDDSVAGEESTLQHIERVAEAVRANTSPRGAEAAVEEAEELRLGWQRLRQGLCEAGDGLRSSRDCHGQYVARCRRLAEDVARLAALLRGVGRELEEEEEGRRREAGERTEEQMVGQWRKYTGVKSTLEAEEAQVEHLKAQLKELFRFSEDSRHLSDDVLAVVKEHQSVKCRATRLCSEAEAGLRQVLQDPLHVHAQWSHMVSQVLAASAEVSEFSHVAMLVQNIERLLKHSVQLQERLSLLQVKGELLSAVFGPERSEGLRGELGSSVRNRELLHGQLLQRKSMLQGLISRTKDFGDAHEAIRSKLSVLRERLLTASSLQPDILAKKSQADQLRVIQKDLEECEAHITALETLVSSSPTNRPQFESLYADWKLLYKAVRVKVSESEESIGEHESFHESLLNVEKWLMIMKQKLESYRSPKGEWSVTNRQHEAERALGEFPEKELQLHQTEAQGQGVLERTSEEGRVHIVRDMKRLRASWLALHDLSLNIYRLLSSSAELSDSERGDQRTRGEAAAAGGQTSLTETLLSLADEDAGPAGSIGGGGSAAIRRPEGTPTGESHSGWAYEGPGSGRARGPESKEGHAAAGGGATVGIVESPRYGQGAWLQGSGELVGRQDEEALGHGPSRQFGVEEVDSLGWGAGRFQGHTGDESASPGARGGFKVSPGGPTPQSSRPVGLSLADGMASGEGRRRGGADEAGSRGREAQVVVAAAKGGHRQGSGGGGGGYGQGGAETDERSGGERLGQGGGAFVLFRRDAAKNASASAHTPTAGSGQALSAGENDARRREFEAWLLRENELLSGILSGKGAALGAKELKIRQDTLKALRAGVGWGQDQFQLLLQGSEEGAAARRAAAAAASGGTSAAAVAAAEDDGLEELRYRWMLYKSKLKDVGDLRVRLNVKGVASKEGHTKALKAQQHVQKRQQKAPGLLHRVCRVALPLWLLFMALLLLLSLLPFMGDGASCSLTNNFARSFNIMLRYDGPPPT